MILIWSKLKSLGKYLNKADFYNQELVKCERELLNNFLKWNLMVISPIYYTLTFISYDLISPSDWIKHQNDENEPICCWCRYKTYISGSTDSNIVSNEHINFMKNLKLKLEWLSISYTETLFKITEAQNISYSTQSIAWITKARYKLGIKPSLSK